MIIGLLEFNLSIPESRSLKDKRMVIRSIKDRISNRFNVSIAEVGRQDSRNFASIAAVVVSVDSASAHRMLENVMDFMRGFSRAVVQEYHIQII
jgi:uncharacterized protein YlxP (DUF503 family)